MGRIITIANQKGGVGKTTTAINLSACLAEAGQHVMLVDFDPQGNASSGLGVEKEDYEHTVYDMMAEEADLDECLVKNIQDNLDVLPSDMNLAGAEIEFQEVEDKETLLKRYLDKVRDNYDFILIDCPPSLNILTINALTAADTVLVPIQCEYYALEGLNQVLKTVELVKRKLNPQLELEGVVFTMYDARTNLSLQVVESVKNNLNQTIYKTIIPRNVRLAEAPSHGMPINLYDTRSTGSGSDEQRRRVIMAKKGLGKGLGAIFGEDVVKENKEETEKKAKAKAEAKAAEEMDEKGRILMLKLDLVQPNKEQPRKTFDEEKINELAESIKNYGVLQPLLVQKNDSFYEIIAGERRWRAAKAAGLKEVPAVLKEYSKQEAMEISLIENVQRADLNPIEEALGYRQLIDEFGLTQEEIAVRVAKSRTAITNTMRLLKLDEQIQNMLVQGVITSGHARALLSLEDTQMQLKAAKEILDKKLSVRETERLVKRLQKEASGEKKEEKKKDETLALIYQDLEDRMKSVMGTKVSIHNKDKNKGRIEIEYYSEAELERIVEMIESIG